MLTGFTNHCLYLWISFMKYYQYLGQPLKKHSRYNETIHNSSSQAKKTKTMELHPS